MMKRDLVLFIILLFVVCAGGLFLSSQNVGWLLIFCVYKIDSFPFPSVCLLFACVLLCETISFHRIFVKTFLQCWLNCHEFYVFILNTLISPSILLVYLGAYSNFG